MISKIGRQAKLAEVRVSILESSVQGMIENIIADALTPIHTSIDALTLRVTPCKKRQRRPFEIPAMKVNTQACGKT